MTGKKPLPLNVRVFAFLATPAHFYLMLLAKLCGCEFEGQLVNDDGELAQ